MIVKARGRGGGVSGIVATVRGMDMLPERHSYHSAGKVLHKPTPSSEVLREIFSYDCESGFLVRHSTGKRAAHWRGSSRTPEKRHYATRLNGGTYRHCRLVWAWHNGDPGSLQVDHIDGNRRNDRIENLRLASNSQNNAAKKHYKGYRKTRTGRYCVDVMKGGIHYYGGTYSSESDAANAANALRKAVHGEFACSPRTKVLARDLRDHDTHPLFRGIGDV